MSALDFEAWAIPDLLLSWKGKEYRVPPPTVERAKQVLAAAVRGEVNLGLVPGPVPEQIAGVLAEIGDSHPGLGEAAYSQMVADDVPSYVIDRYSYHAVFHWARGADYAAFISTLLWAPREPAEGAADGGEGAAPKG